MYANKVSGKVTLFHEWFHSNDYFEGTASRLTSLYNHTDFHNILEFRAHSFSYLMSPTQTRFGYVVRYANKVWGH